MKPLLKTSWFRHVARIPCYCVAGWGHSYGIKRNKNKDGSVLTLQNIYLVVPLCVCGPINSHQSTTRAENNQHATVLRKNEGNGKAWLCSTLVGVRVPGTDGTSQPLICRIVCRTVHMWSGMSQPFGYAERPADTITVTSSHALEHSQRWQAWRQSVRQTDRQTDWLSAPTHCSQHSNPDN